MYIAVYRLFLYYCVLYYLPCELFVFIFDLSYFGFSYFMLNNLTDNILCLTIKYFISNE